MRLSYCQKQPRLLYHSNRPILAHQETRANRYLLISCTDRRSFAARTPEGPRARALPGADKARAQRAPWSARNEPVSSGEVSAESHKRTAFVFLPYGVITKEVIGFCGSWIVHLSLRGAQRRGNPFSCRPLVGVHRKGLVCIFFRSKRKKIDVRLGLALAGGAHPRRIELFESTSG